MLFDNVISSGFAPKITLLTRMCDTSSTLIGNVYTNTINKKHTSGIPIRPISDHQMYFCILNENYTTAINVHRYIEVEVCNEYSVFNLKLKLPKQIYTTSLILVQVQIKIKIMNF